MTSCAWAERTHLGWRWAALRRPLLLVSSSLLLSALGIPEIARNCLGVRGGHWWLDAACLPQGILPSLLLSLLSRSSLLRLQSSLTLLWLCQARRSASHCAYWASGSLLLLSKSLALVSSSLEDRGFDCSPSRWSIQASIHADVGGPLQLSLLLRRQIPALLLLVYCPYPRPL